MLGARNTAYRIKIIVVFCTFAAVNFLAESAREQEFTFKITTIFEPTVGVWESWEPLSHRIQHGRFARERVQAPRYCWDTNCDAVGVTFLANVNSRSRSLYAIARPYVVCL